MELPSRASKFFRDYRKSEVVFEENSQGHEMFIVQSGQVKLFTRAPGRTVELATLGPGEFFGEMALVDKAPRTATAVVHEEGTRLIVLDQEKFMYLVVQQPAFVFTIMHSLCSRIRERWSLVSDLRSPHEYGAPFPLE